MSVFEILAAGEELTLPHIGMETLHHVHAGTTWHGPLSWLSSARTKHLASRFT